MAWANDAQQTLLPSNSAYTPGRFTISVLVPPVSDLSVQYALSGTAAPGTDYLAPAGYAVVSGTGVVTIPAGQSQVQVTIDPNITPLPPYKADDIATITLLPAGTYTLTSAVSATLAIDQARIQVDEVTSETANGTYHAGDAIILDVVFSAPVTVTGSGTPTLALNTGATNTSATYIPPVTPPGGPAPTPTATLRFLYTVANGDVNAHLDYLTSASLVLPGGTAISDANLHAATPALDHNPLFPVSTALPAPATTGSLSSNSALVIDGTPAVAFNTIPAHLDPSEVGPTAGTFTVTCTPGPAVPLTVFYTLAGSAVQGTDIAAPGGTPGQLVIPAGATSVPLAIMPLANPVFNPHETVIMTLVAGTGYHLAARARGDQRHPDRGPGQHRRAQRHRAEPQRHLPHRRHHHPGGEFSDVVNVSSGTPTLALNAASGAVATYAGGTGTATLLFTYVVAVGDASPALDYTGTTALTGALAGASLPVLTALAAPGAAGSAISAGSTLVIDGSPAIALLPSGHLDTTTVGASPAPGRFTVTCTPAPTANLTVNYTLGNRGHRHRHRRTVISAPANFTTGTATGQLTIPANATSAILTIAPIIPQTLTASAAVVMTLVAGPGYHLAGAPAVASDTITVAQDAIVIAGVSALPTSGTFHLGGQITITVAFTAPVAVSGTPTLALNTGATGAIATYASGSGTATLDFTYVVGAGDASAHLDYLSAVALNLDGGSIMDSTAASLPVTIALAAPGSHGSLASNTTLVIDGTVPVVTAVSATSANGTYTYGQSLTLTVTFSLPVDVSGTPELQLATGATPAEATYAGGNGTAILDFTYVVGANDASSDLDCTSASALTLNGGSITWAGALSGTVGAALGLPVPGAAGSLGANKQLVINGALPTGKPPVGSISGPDAGTGGGCGLGSGIAGLAGALTLCLRALALRRQRRDPR